MTRTPFTPPTTEKDWWRLIRENWSRWKGGPGGRNQIESIRMESATVKGIGDVYTEDVATGTVAWIELKVLPWPRAYERIMLVGPKAIRPEQLVFARERAANRVRAGFLIAFLGRSEWLWIPAQPSLSWIQQMSAPGSLWTTPHLWGRDSLPPIPPLLFWARVDGSICLFEAPPKAKERRNTLHGDFKARQIIEYVPWPPFDDAEWRTVSKHVTERQEIHYAKWKERTPLSGPRSAGLEKGKAALAKKRGERAVAEARERGPESVF